MSSNLPIRIDKEIQQNLLDFNLYEKDNPLIMSIFVYILDLQFKSSDMFHQVIIDLNEFAKNIGYKSKSNLLTVLPKEELVQYKHRPDLFEDPETPRDLLFLTRFENCLYQLFAVNFHYSRFVKNTRIDMSITSKTTILDEVRIFLDKSEKRKKQYVVKLSDRIIDNLYNFYSDFNKDVFVQLPHKNQTLYLILCNIYNCLKANLKYHYEYDYLMQAAGLLSFDSKNQRSKLKQALEDIKAVDTNMKIYVEFRKRYDDSGKILKYGDQVQYEIYFALDHSENSQLSELTKSTDSFYFDDYLEKKLFAYFFKKYAKNKDKTFMIDYKNLSEDYEAIKRSYLEWRSDQNGGIKKDHVDVVNICYDVIAHFHPYLKADVENLKKKAFAQFKKLIGEYESR